MIQNLKNSARRECPWKPTLKGRTFFKKLTKLLAQWKERLTLGFHSVPHPSLAEPRFHSQRDVLCPWSRPLQHHLHLANLTPMVKGKRSDTSRQLQPHSVTIHVTRKARKYSYQLGSCVSRADLYCHETMKEMTPGTWLVPFATLPRWNKLVRGVFPEGVGSIK